MQKGLSLSALAAKIEGNRALKHDFVSDTRAMSMVVVPTDEPNSKPSVALERKQSAAGGPATFPLLSLAHDQIGDRLGIPAKYYDRMLAEDPKLLATNVNAWFASTPQRRMVRTLGGDVRAFLSDKYNRIENEEIATVVLPILAEIPGVEIVSSEITERRLYIQAVTPRMKAVKVGDEVQAGVVISNSEVGCGAVSVSPMIWRLKCLNGMIGHDGKFKANHVGRRVEEGADLNIQYADDTRQADDRAVLLKVRDHVHHAIGELGFGQRVEKMAALAESREIKNPMKTIEVLAQKFGVGEGERETILTSLIKGGDLSAWGILNAVTHQAHSPSISYDRAVEFEMMGGKLLDLPKGQWAELLEAA